MLPRVLMSIMPTTLTTKATTVTFSFQGSMGTAFVFSIFSWASSSAAAMGWSGSSL